MTTLIESIIAGVISTVSAAAVTTDASSPSTFTEEVDCPIEHSEMDRGFVVDVTGTDTIDYVNATTKTRRYVKLAVVMVCINEGDSDSDAAKVIWKDVHRIQDRVFMAFNMEGLVTGVDNVSTDGMATIIKTAQPTRRFVNIPFQIFYEDDVVTS